MRNSRFSALIMSVHAATERLLPRWYDMDFSE